jgi:hypothetical protein
MNFFSKLSLSLARRGLVGTLRHAVNSLQHRLWNLTPGGRNSTAQRLARDKVFDDRYGVDTGGMVRLSELNIANENRLFGTDYAAIDPDEFVGLMQAANLHYPDYTFVDFGSGKGRAVLLASGYPFKKVIGVEFSQKLVDIAQENLRRYPAERKKCTDIEIHCVDATQYVLPNEPLALYFYHPFAQEIMTQVVARVVASHAAHPRDIRVIYANPFEDHAWSTATFLEKVVSRPLCSIYKPRKTA